MDVAIASATASAPVSGAAPGWQEASMVEVVDLGVREVPGGLVSPHLVRGPYGRFIGREAETRPVLLVGAGSGLVPLMSMVRYAHARGRRKTVWLVCSAATYAHAFYRDEL